MRIIYRPLVMLLGLSFASIRLLWCQTGNISEQYLFSAANGSRLEHNLRPVQLDPLLAKAALFHAREMAAHRTISHQFSGEPDLAARAGSAGVHFSLVTENVAEASNSSLIHDLWMQSAGHRANLLDPQVDSIGIAVIAVRGQLYAVEDFARSVRHLALEDQEAEVAELVASSGVRILSDSGDARETCALSTGYVGRRQPWFVMRYTAADLSRLPEELSAKLQSGRYREAEVGACTRSSRSPFTSYNIAVLLYP